MPEDIKGTLEVNAKEGIGLCGSRFGGVGSMLCVSCFFLISSSTCRISVSFTRAVCSITTARDFMHKPDLAESLALRACP